MCVFVCVESERQVQQMWQLVNIGGRYTGAQLYYSFNFSVDYHFSSKLIKNAYIKYMHFLYINYTSTKRCFKTRKNFSF